MEKLGFLEMERRVGKIKKRKYKRSDKKENERKKKNKYARMKIFALFCIWFQLNAN